MYVYQMWYSRDPVGDENRKCWKCYVECIKELNLFQTIKKTQIRISWLFDTKLLSMNFYN